MFMKSLNLRTSLLTDVVVRCVTVHIVPVVVPVEEEGVVHLHHAHAVLAVEVVRFPISPVEPLDRLVLVRPEPLPRGVLVVTLSSEGSHPELDPVSGLEHVEELGLEPVVDPGVVQLSHPRVVSGTQDRGVVPGDPLGSVEPEAPAARPVLLEDPAVRAVVSVLRSYPGAPLCVTHSILTWARV